MTQTLRNIEGILSADIVNLVREEYKISNKYSSYIIESGFLKKIISDMKYDEIKVNKISKIEKNKFIIDKKDGMIDGKYYKIITLLVEASGLGDDFIFLLFTDNIIKFEKELMSRSKIKPLEKGVYKIIKVRHGYDLEKIDNKNVVKPILNDDLFTMVEDEIIKFIKNKNIYTKNNMPYKRGVLLYGLPGNGKTSFIKYILNKIPAYSIICNTQNYEEVEFLHNILLNEELNGSLKIIVMEDLDKMESFGRSILLNIIDGVIGVNNVIFIATTNDPMGLDKAFINRPSRFDSLYNISSPNAKSREILLKTFFPKISNEELIEMVKKTENLKGCHFKEIYLMTELHKYKIGEAIDKLLEKFKIYNEFTQIKKDEYFG